MKLNPLEKRIVEGIKCDITRFEMNDFNDMGSEYEELELWRFELGNEIEYETELTGLAINFWDSWIDQTRHGFEQEFYEDINKNSWTKLAREIVRHIEGHLELKDTVLLKNFGIPSKVNRAL